jgi:FemAB-related protein (PEP-CTERM system-associated)
VRVFRSAHPDLVRAWDGTSADPGQPHLAHAAEWLRAIPEAYGHDPLYLSAEDGDGGRGFLPAFVVRRPLMGSIVSSMPFLDGGGPSSASAAVGDTLVAGLIEEARRIGAEMVELRSARKLDLAAEPLEHKVNLTLSLPADSETLWRQLDGRVRNQVRKAERSGLSVESGGGELLDAFYGVFVARMRELGSPVHARRFFAAVLDAFGERARVVVVRKGAATVGGLIALAFKDVLTVPWASCLSRHLGLCPNMLLYWETMRAGCREGLRRFDFGRSSRGSGTYRFKRQWGAGESPLFWYTVSLRGEGRARRPGTGRAAALLAGSWRRLPLALTRQLGPHIRRYLTR